MAKKFKGSVDDFMAQHETPFKAEVQVVRDIIKGVNPAISEIVKWNAPSYVYNNTDTLTFNLWSKNNVHLVFHHPLVVTIASPLLEGDYPTRRMAYFNDMADIEAQRTELTRVIATLITRIDEA